MAGAPFVRRAYPGPQGSRVSDLLLRAGQVSGEGEARRGEIRANRYSADAARQGEVARSIAGMISGVGQQISQYAQQAPQRELVKLNLEQAKAQSETSKLVTAALDQNGGDLGKAIVWLEGQGRGAAANLLRDKRREQQAQESSALLNGFKVREAQFSEGNRLVAAALADPAQYPKIAPRLKTLADQIEQGWGDMVPPHFDPKALAAFDNFTLTEAERAARLKAVSENAERVRAGVKTQSELEDWGTEYLARYFSLQDPAQAKSQDFETAMKYMRDRGVSPVTLSQFGENVQDAIAASKKILAPKPDAAKPGDLADRIARKEKALGRGLSEAELRQVTREYTDDTDKTPNASAGDVSANQLTSEALDMAAHQFAITGAMPTLGLGKEAAASRAKIINRAAEMYSGLDLPTQIAAYNSAKQSLAKRGEQLSSITAFEETAMANLERFIKAAGEVPDTGLPFLNRPLRSISRDVLGDPKMAAFETARLAVVPELARIITNPNLNGVLSDSARHEVDTLLRGDYSLAQIKKAAEMLVADAKQRKTSLQDEVGALQKRIASPPKTRPQAEAPPDVLSAISSLNPPPVEGEEVELSDGSVWVITNGVPVKKGGA